MKGSLARIVIGLGIVAALGCAEKPGKKVASGEDTNLFSKKKLLGEGKEVASIDGREATLFESLPGDPSLVSVEITKSFLTIYAGASLSDPTKAIRQYKVDGHFDLVEEKDKDGKESYYLVKDDTKNKDWSERAYVEVDPGNAKAIKAKEQTLVNLVAVDSLKAKYKLGVDAIPGLTQRESEAILQQFGLQAGDVLYSKLTKSEFILYVKSKSGNPIIVSRARVAYYDLVRAENADGEKTAEIVRDQDQNIWTARSYVEINPENTEIQDGSQKIIDKAELAGKCFASGSPIPELDALLKKTGKIQEGDEICFEVSQSVLTVQRKSDKGKDLLLTLAIDDHLDINLAGNDITDILSPGTHKRTWDKRQFLKVKLNNPQWAENRVDGQYMQRAMLDGEFVYVATVVAAHSENGGFFEGQTLVSDDRLEFVYSEDNVTAYKVLEPLNQSGAKTPAMRFGVDHFTVERQQNSYGDGTNVISENRDDAWQQRKHIRPDFADNQITSYFNNVFGIQKLLGWSYNVGSSEMVSDVTVEDGYFSYDTETVLVPKVGVPRGEAGYVPMAVTVRHSFVRVDERDYQAREYTWGEFNRFGYFWTTEYGLDDDLQPTDDTIKHYIGRHDTSGDKKIVFYMNEGFPERYKSIAQGVVDAWNVSLKAATGRDDVMELRENSGQDVGDPRHNMIVWAQSRALRAPAGYGPSISDPKTGEFISSRTFMYEEAVRSIRRIAGDYYDLIKEGKIPEEFARDLTPGTSGIDPATPIGSEFDTSLTDLTSALPEGLIEWRDAVQGVTAPAIDVVAALDNAQAAAPESIRSLLGDRSGRDLMRTMRERQGFKRYNDYNSFLAAHGQCAVELDEHIISAIRFIMANQDKDREQMMDELEELSVFNILMHEIGHNLGLRHNFQGSYDEFNFHDEYFDLKRREDAGEVVEGEYSMNYRVSSVMDYNDLFEGLAKRPGKYDTAAIKYGYGSLLEVVEFDDNGQPVFDENGLIVTEDVHVDDLTQGMLLRPYMFCTDGHVSNDPTCNRFDRGISISEITESLTSQYDVTYFMRGFRRGRRLFTGTTGAMTRTILPVRQVLDELFYKLIQGDFEGQQVNDPIQPGNFADYFAALNTGLNFYVKVLSAIEPGTYHYDLEAGKLVQGQSNEEGAINVIVPLGVGKHLLPAFAGGGGDFEGQERILRAGVEFDKLATMMALSMRGFPALKYRRASLSVNYFAVAKEPLLNLFSEIMRGKLETNVNMVQAQPGVFVAVGEDYEPRDGEQVFTVPADSSSSLLLEIYAKVFTVLNYNSNVDRTFSDYIDFRIKGENDMGLPAGVERVEFTSASGLRTYVVPQTADGNSISFAIASEAAELEAQRAQANVEIEALGVQVAEVIEANYDAVLDATLVVYEIREGQPLSEAAVERYRAERTRENLVLFLDFMTESLPIVTEQGNEEDIAAVQAQLDSVAEVAPQIQALDEEMSTLESSLEDSLRELTTIESQLLELKEIYEIFN